MVPGLGKTSGKGHKGAKARSGHGKGAYFEGGQLPLVRRLPKRGFTNIFAKEYATVNVSALEIFEDGATVDIYTLIKNGLIKKPFDGLKVLGDGEITKKLTVRSCEVHQFCQRKDRGCGRESRGDLTCLRRYATHGR